MKRLFVVLWGNGDGIYVDNIRGENCPFRLLTWNSYIGQFVHTVEGEGLG